MSKPVRSPGKHELMGFKPVHCSLFRDLAYITRKGDEQIRKNFTAPDDKRTLQFSCNSKRAAQILDLSPSSFSDLKKHPDAPEGQIQGNNRRLYSLDDLEQFRKILIDKGAMAYPPRRRTNQPCTVFAISNLKGGVAKTTLTTNLATHLTIHGYRVLVVDLDPQGSATGILDPHAALNLGPDDTMLGPLLEDPEKMIDVIRPTVWSLLDLVPAMPNLHYAEMQMFQNMSADNPLWERVKNALDTVKDDYDVILLDTAPTLSPLMLGSVWAADWVLMPAQASWVDNRAMEAFFSNLWSHLENIEEETGEQKFLAGIRIILSNYRGPTEWGNKEPLRSNVEHTIAGIMRSMMGPYMADSVLAHSPAFRTAALQMTTIHELPTNDRTNQRALDSFWELGNEVVSMLETYRCYVESLIEEEENA